VACGVKATLIVQDAFAASVDAQLVLVTEKFAGVGGG
jgi:hypothetical protein